MRRITFFLYGIACYSMFLGVFLYAIGFIGNFAVPTRLDGEATSHPLTAISVNLAVLSVFALQHSVMARPSFKQWWTQFVPKPIERSTYVLCSNLAMMLMFAAWQPMGGTVWDLGGAGQVAMYFLFGVGWLTVLYSTFLVNHFDLFGLRQVWLNLRNQPYTTLPFREPSLYRYVRHPLYVGWLMVMWFTPTMTASHLLFALITTAYILIAIQLEERDLVKALPGYAEYRRRVPMLWPAIVSQKPVDGFSPSYLVPRAGVGTSAASRTSATASPKGRNE